MKKSNLYTKTGDSGQTSLVGGKRVAKTDARLEAYGTDDELNSCIGMLREMVDDERDSAFLLGVQHRLFALGGYLATDRSASDVQPSCLVTRESLAAMEHEIDLIDETLPPLHAFVLPGGCRASAWCNVCRTVCRRMERAILRLDDAASIDPVLTAYVNRLSDYLFVLSRKLNAAAGASEIFWDKSCV